MNARLMGVWMIEWVDAWLEGGNRGCGACVGRLRPLERGWNYYSTGWLAYLRSIREQR